MAQTNDRKSNDLLVKVAALGGLATMATAAVVGMLRIVDHFSPRIGDIITFNPTKTVSPNSEPRIAVVPAGTASVTSCILDVRAMRQSAGSLVIEATRPDPIFRYRVHWAGALTSDGQTNCGDAADLLLSEYQITSLKMAAGQ